MQEGLSPRGRGNHAQAREHQSGRRSIPAWAGKPVSLRLSASTLKVYPRVGGETAQVPRYRGRSKGLSPRGRGNRKLRILGSPFNGSIPAWAGKPSAASRRSRHGKVYPRVGGETRFFNALCRDSAGLSPRGRGNQRRRPRRQRQNRSIPAWAGKPMTARSARARSKVYPRVGGETAAATPTTNRNRGLSPRGRGNHGPIDHLQLLYRSIPAWAGKPTERPLSATMLGVYPRVGGETPIPPTFSSSATGLSPRGRGNHRLQSALPGIVWSIPAWAGKPAATGCRRGCRRVYPRVGGETFVVGGTVEGQEGLSPRGRGNRSPP